MEISHYATAHALADGLVTLWGGPRADPFRFDLAVVPTSGFQRWISQQLARADGAEGICAGIEFSSPRQLWTRLAGQDDPWRPDRLGWLIQQIVLAPDASPGLEVLRRHLDASRESYSASSRIAAQFSGYATHLPGMLAHWAAGEDVDGSGQPLVDHRWQPVLWRELVAAVGSSPLEQRQAVLDALRAGPAAQLPQRIAVLAPPRLDPAALELYEALSQHHEFTLLVLNRTPSRVIAMPASGRRSELARRGGHRLNEGLGGLADENAALLGPPLLGSAPPAAASRPDNILGWLLDDLAADRQGRSRTLSGSDDSVQLHFSHGPARQVEVLREVLAQLYATDPTLQPRDIVVLTPDLDSFGPLLDAAFTPQPGTVGHPAHQFRLRLADRSAAQANPLVGLLLDLLRMPDSRLEATALLELCASEPIANRFGFSADDGERLAELVSTSGVRWGLNAAHRAGYGLPSDLAHNTWQAGLQRMLLGVTLSEHELVSVGTVLPMDDVDSSDVALIGGLTELIGRLSRWLVQLSSEATLTDWVSRCRDGLEALIRLPAAQEWQLADLFAGLSRLSEAGTLSAARLSRHAIITAIEDSFTSTGARGSFGNGSTLVAGLDSLRDVPHRVIVLLGWDAERYPRSRRSHGDDLVGVAPPLGTPSAALSDRQALLDALHSASEKLVVICRDRSEATNKEVPLATPIIELIEALNATATTAEGRGAGDALSVHHPLQPFAAEYFSRGSALSSVDPLAYAAARAAHTAHLSPAPGRDRFALESLPPLDLSGGVSLDELTDFYRHPARTLLRVRAGISLGEEPDPADAIPIEPDGLARWQIGNRVLRRLSEGLEADAVERAEWLRGQVPPFELGRQVMSGIMSDARRTLANTPPPGPAQHHDLSLRIPVTGRGEIALTGRVATRDSTIWQVEFSSLQPRSKLTAWLRLLALAAAEPGSWDAMVVGKGRRTRYQAPPATQARDLLSRYLAIYALGLERPLPALPRLTAEWANLRVSRSDPDDARQRKSLRRCWDWDSDQAWTKFFDYPGVVELPLDGLDLPGADPSETTLVGALASSIWAPALAAEVAS